MIRIPRPRRPRPDGEKGASAVEYGLLVAAIAAVIVGTVFTLGSFVNKSFQHTSDCIAEGTPGYTAPLDPAGAPLPGKCTP